MLQIIAYSVPDMTSKGLRENNEVYKEIYTYSRGWHHFSSGIVGHTNIHNLYLEVHSLRPKNQKRSLGKYQTFKITESPNFAMRWAQTTLLVGLSLLPQSLFQATWTAWCQPQPLARVLLQPAGVKAHTSRRSGIWHGLISGLLLLTFVTGSLLIIATTSA